MNLEFALISVIVLLLLIILSSLPLYITIRLLGGRVSILRAFLVMLIVGVTTFFIEMFFSTWGVILAWILMIWIFREVFRLKWLKAVLAWIIWLVLIFVFSFILSIFGLTLLFF